MSIAQMRMLIVALLGCWLVAGCIQPASTQEQMLRAQQSYLSQHYHLSFEQIQGAAASGDPDAQYALGYMFFYGKGTATDNKLANYWIKKAAAQGQPQAQRAVQLLQQADSAPPVPDTSAMPFFNEPDAIQHSLATSRANRVTKISSNPPVRPRPFTTAPPKSSNDPVTRPDPRVIDVSNPATYSRTVPTASSKPDKRAYTSVERRLLAAPPSYYTVQLLDVRHENEALNFIRNNHLQRKASYYSTYSGGRNMYIIVYGQYSSVAEARAAIKTLPPKVQQLKPWIKPLSEVQRGLSSN